MKYKSLFALQTLVIIIIIGFASLFIYSLYDKEYKLTTQNTLKNTREQCSIIIDKYENMAEFYFHNTINTPEILQCVHDAWQTESQEKRQKIRQELFKTLLNSYHLLLNSGFRQLHFHFPDNTSFLRMHRPDTFGDNLTDFRETVRLANERKEFIKGFEEGKIFNGYRFVYPLFYKNNHIGSVEVSVSYNTPGNALKKIGFKSYFLIILKDVIDQKLMDSEKNNYSIFPYNTDYSIDRGTFQNDLYFKQLSSVKNLFEKMNSETDFTLNISKDNEIHTYFLSVKNVKNQHVGYFVTFNEMPQLNDLQRIMLYKQLFLVFIAICLISLFYLFYKKSLKFKELEKFLPICASCKKIRIKGTDPQVQESWTTIESYFKSNTDLKLSHGICPACREELYGEYLNKNKND